MEQKFESGENKAGVKRKALVLIYGDNKEQELAKMTWSALHGQDIEIAPVTTQKELQERSSEACLVLVFCHSGIEGAPEKSVYDLVPKRDLLCADFIAVIYDADANSQIDMLASGYDAVFDIDFTKSRDFSTILQKRITKTCKRLEMKAAWAEYETFKEALNASPDSYILFDRHKKLVYASSHYYLAYPHTADKLKPGTALDDIYGLLAKEQGIFKDNPQYNNLKAFWQKTEGETKFYLPNSKRVWRLRGRQLPDNKGSIVITSDITEHENQKDILNNNSADLEKALEEAQEANAIQKQFINMVSHEFRTPLTIIDGNVQILQKRGSRLDEESFQKRCKTIRSAISRLVYIMESVLSSNMMRTGRFQLVPEDIDLKKLIKEMCEEFSDISPSLDITCDVDSLPDIVHLDRKVVTLVLTNLLSNAVKFSKSTPHINVRGYLEGKDSGESVDVVTIEVGDNGIGIPENDIDRIFDRYYRASTASGIAGTGIGLSLVKDLLDLLQGQIDVESDTDRGTKFVVKMPMNDG